MESVGEQETWVAKADRKEMDAVFHLCRRDDWKGVLAQIERNPWISTTPMIMDNNITTTCLHQAITSKSGIQDRAKVIRRILEVSPEAARIKNGYGSLPLHVIAQRNTKMKSETKEELIFELVRAYPGALAEEGGVGKRTPLHIIFTDYVSPRLTRMMVDRGAQACFMKDKKGYLPAHVAASRHCSPEKLRMLLAVNPASLVDTTADGETLLSLATSTATKSHPNYALIEELHRQHTQMPGPPVTARHLTELSAAPAPHHSHAHDVHQYYQHQPYRQNHHEHHHHRLPRVGFGPPPPPPYTTTPVSGSSRDSGSSRGRLDSNDSHRSSSNGSWPSPPPPPPPPPAAGNPFSAAPTDFRRERKRKSLSSPSSGRAAEYGGPMRWSPPPATTTTTPSLPPLDDPVGLLLHFSQAATTPAAGETDRGGGGGGQSVTHGGSSSATQPPPRYHRPHRRRQHDPPHWPWGDDRDDEEGAPLNVAQV